MQPNDRIEHFYPRAIAIARAHAKSYGTDPEESSGDALEALVQAAQKFDPDRHKHGEAGFSNYAYIVIHGRLIDKMRSQNKGLSRADYKKGLRIEKVSINELNEDQNGFEQPRLQVSSPEFDLAIQMDYKAALASLPPRQRAIYTLVDGGYSGAELARATGLSGSRISQLLKEARTKIQERMVA